MNDSPGSLVSASKQKSLEILKLSDVSIGKYRTSLPMKVEFGASYNVVKASPLVEPSNRHL